MRLGIANKETWIFLEEIFEYLSSRYPTQIFEPASWPLPLWRPKMSHYMLRRSLNQFIHDCDVVLFEWASELLVEASGMRTPAAAALVVRLHRYEMFQWVQRIRWDAVSYVILDTEAMRKKLLERTNVAPGRTLVLPNAVPLHKTSSEVRPFQGNIAALCNLIPRKRVYELILGFYAVLQHYPDARLHIGGDGRPAHRDYEEALRDLARRLGIADKVAFYGRVHERWDWYQKMDIFVSYSYSEGMPVAPIEAIASGCYCLSHWWEGADEIFPKEQIFLTEDEFVAKTLAYCRATDEGRRQMGEPLRKFVIGNCDLEKVTARIQEVLELAAGERSRC